MIYLATGVRAQPIEAAVHLLLEIYVGCLIMYKKGITFILYDLSYSYILETLKSLYKLQRPTFMAGPTPFNGLLTPRIEPD